MIYTYFNLDMTITIKFSASSTLLTGIGVIYSLQSKTWNTSVSQEYVCTVLSRQLTTTAYKINSVSASFCVLGMRTLFDWEEIPPFWVYVVIGS